MLEAMAKGGGTHGAIQCPRVRRQRSVDARRHDHWIGDMSNNSLKERPSETSPRRAVPILLTSHTKHICACCPISLPKPGQPWRRRCEAYQAVLTASGVSWWPSELGNPSAHVRRITCGMRIFPPAIGLPSMIKAVSKWAIRADTGYSRLRSNSRAATPRLTFTSQRGVVRVDSLPRAPSGARPPFRNPLTPRSSPSIPASPVQQKPAAVLLALIDSLRDGDGGLARKGSRRRRASFLIAQRAQEPASAAR